MFEYIRRRPKPTPVVDVTKPNKTTSRWCCMAAIPVEEPPTPRRMSEDDELELRIAFCDMLDRTRRGSITEIDIKN